MGNTVLYFKKKKNCKIPTSMQLFLLGGGARRRGGGGGGA
jgi:hypothetical protein